MTFPSLFFFNLNTHFKPMDLYPGGKLVSAHVLFFSMSSSSAWPLATSSQLLPHSKFSTPRLRATLTHRDLTLLQVYLHKFQELNFFDLPSVVDPHVLSHELSYSREFITHFGVIGDDMCGHVGVIVGVLSRSVACSSSSKGVNSVTVCLLLPMLHQSHIFSSSNMKYLRT